MILPGILIDISKEIATFLAAKGYHKITESNISEYEKELHDIITLTNKEYKHTNPIKKIEKTVFYDSQTFLQELLKFRFTHQYDRGELERALVNDGRIAIPTEEELNEYFRIFDKHIQGSVKIKELNIEDNYKEEIFNISNSIREINTAILELRTVLNEKRVQEPKLSEYESKLLIRLFDFQSPCKIAAAKGELDCLWVPGDIYDMQWGWEKTPSEVQFHGKVRGDRDNRLHWILVVKQLVEKGWLTEVEKNHYELTDDGQKIAFMAKNNGII